MRSAELCIPFAIILMRQPQLTSCQPGIGETMEPMRAATLLLFFAEK